MLIGTNQKLARLRCRELNLAINNHKLDTVESEKLLGVHFDRNLSFMKDVDFVCKNISSKIALLCRIKQYLPLQARKLYFNSYILPVIDYCLTVWGNAPKLHTERIHKLDKRATRVILDSPPDSSSQPLFEELGWLTVFERVEYNKAILLYKSVNNMSPTYISSLIFKILNITAYVLLKITIWLSQNTIWNYSKIVSNIQVPRFGMHCLQPYGQPAAFQHSSIIFIDI